MMQLKKKLQTQARKEEKFSSLEVAYEEEYALAWYRMNAKPRPCFTPEVVGEIQKWFNSIIADSQHNNLKYLVMGSSIPSVFCLGGDLNLFLDFISRGDREGIYKYDEACIRAMYQIYTDLGKELTTIALVQGDALGGGLKVFLPMILLLQKRVPKWDYQTFYLTFFLEQGHIASYPEK